MSTTPDSTPNDRSANDRPADEAADEIGHEPKADRPGGPGQAGQAVVDPGQVAPAPDDDDRPSHDDVVQRRRDHLRDN